MKKVQILVVDDEWNMRNLLRVYLNQNGYDVYEAKNGREALRVLKKINLDLILLDVMLPGMDGWEVCKTIRMHSSVPILMLTARTETMDKVYGLTIGADDYLAKPFEPEELVARVYALLRRSNVAENAEAGKKLVLQFGLVIDLEKRQVAVNGEVLEFTLKEFDLLVKLAEHPNCVLSRETLLENVWGMDYVGGDRTVDTHIKNIRSKLRNAGISFNLVQTVWGIGYKFQEPDV